MKKVIATLLAIATTLSSVAVCIAENTSEFTDLNEKNKYYDEIVFLSELGVVSGF